METLKSCSLDGQEGSLHRIANRVRQSLELQEILDATAIEIRDYLGIDRVKVYKFNPSGNGIVIAESIDHHRLPSLLGLNFPADDIPPYAKELFLKARQRSVVDIPNHCGDCLPATTANRMPLPKQRCSLFRRLSIRWG